MLQSRGEEEGRARLSLTEGSDLFCFAAGWRPPTRRSAGPILSLRSLQLLPFLPSPFLSLSLTLSLALSLNSGETKDAVRQIEPVEEKGWRKGAGWETGQLVEPLPVQRSRLRARPRTGPLGWEKEGETAPLLCAWYYSVRTGRAEFDAGRSRDQNVETRRALRRAFTRYNLPNGAPRPRAFNDRRAADAFRDCLRYCRMLLLQPLQPPPPPPPRRWKEEWQSVCGMVCACTRQTIARVPANRA